MSRSGFGGALRVEIEDTGQFGVLGLMDHPQMIPAEGSMNQLDAGTCHW